MFKKVFQVILKIYANSCEVLQGIVENAILTLIWVGFLGVRFEVRVSGEEVSNITPPPLPYLKVVWIMLESTYPYVVSENMSFSVKALLILLMAVLLQKISVFWPKCTFTQKQ